MMQEIAEIGYMMLALLALAMLLSFVRLARGPSLTDRVVAVDLITTIGVAMSALYAMLHDSMVFLDVAILIALISFVGTIAFARYIEARGATSDER
jgi:multicomponent Na+:H+ antiporter subunit F